MRLIKKRSNKTIRRRIRPIIMESIKERIRDRNPGRTPPQRLNDNLFRKCIFLILLMSNLGRSYLSALFSDRSNILRTDDIQGAQVRSRKVRFSQNPRMDREPDSLDLLGSRIEYQ